MRVQLYEDAKAFAAAVTPPLARRAVLNNVFVGVVERMVTKPEAGHLRAAVWDRDALVLAALMTPPYRLNLAHAGRGREGGVALAKALHALGVALPGISGETPVAESFAAAWFALTGATRGEAHKRLLYEAKTIEHPKGIPGALVAARRDDFERHFAWELAFLADVEAQPSDMRHDLVRASVERWYEREAAFDWVVDGAPVAHGVVWPIGEDGARVLAIYTPPVFRGRGYAQAMTAALTQRAHDAGRWCTLFTDAENPVTNKIYPRVGYRLVAPFVDLMFGR